ncbi:MAG: hypothetical protein ACRDGD_04675 [Candidatus Limnocylindria bacterium]
MTKHRVYVWPWLRPVGGLLIHDWLAITIGHRIFAWRSLRADELAHELAHVRQWARHGWLFPFIYLADSFRARRAGKRWYHDNRFEAEARLGTEPPDKV